MEELVGFLSHNQANVRETAAAHVANLSGTPEGLAALKQCPALIQALAKISGDIPGVARNALSALINLAQEPGLIPQFEKCRIANRCAENLSETDYPLLQLDVILLANLTGCSEAITRELITARGGAALLTLAQALKEDKDAEHESLDFVTNILAHVAQYEVRLMFCHDDCDCFDHRHVHVLD